MSEPLPALPTCNSLWIGGSDLGPMSAACLASFVRRGHPMVLYCYDVPSDVPAGVKVVDAATILPASRIIRHKATGSTALFANFFRYELIRRGLGIWVDCDVYCLRPILPGNPHVYGWQGPRSVNNAVLGLPTNSPVLERLIAIFESPWPALPWLSNERQAELVAKKLAGGTFDLGELPWGAAGPVALSYLLSETGLARWARPQTVFYPIGHEQWRTLLMRGVDVASVMSPQTLTVHLWNQSTAKNLAKRERGSALDRLVSQGTLFDEARLGIG